MSFKSMGYKSSKSKLAPDWAKRSDREPIVDKQAVAYGWVIKASPQDYDITSVMATAPSGGTTIDQEALEPIRVLALDKLIRFYNKIDNEFNRQILLDATFVKDIRVPTRPKSKLLFYVLIPARAFDDIPEKGYYTKQRVPDRSTLHTLAEDYRGYFKNNVNSEVGRRARIAEILRANSISVESADEGIIKSWIAGVNGTSEDIFFIDGAAIFLPRMTMPNPPEPTFQLSLEIQNIKPVIDSAIKNLEYYAQKIKDFTSTTGGQVENLDLQNQIDLLNDFYPAFQKHVSFNDMELKYFQDDEMLLFLGPDYDVIYIAINHAGEKIPLLKGMPNLTTDVAPFNSMRTMALLVRIKEIADIKQTKLLGVEDTSNSTFSFGTNSLYLPQMAWEEFVKEYIVPPVEINTVDPMNLLNELMENNSIVQELVMRFEKNIKYEEDLEEEAAVLADPKIMAKAADQQSKRSAFIGDKVLSNLSKINKKADAQGSLFTNQDVVDAFKSAGSGVQASGARVLNATYKELLNRISITKLTEIAMECLRKLVTCDALIEGILEKNLLIGYSTFKIKLPPSAQYMADRALMIAQSQPTNWVAGGVDYSDAGAHFEAESIYYAGQTDSSALEMGLLGKGKTPGKVFIAVLKMGLARETSVNFDRLLEEVCIDLSNFQFPDLFKIPTMSFPHLPTVDLFGTVVAMLESAIVELLVNLVVMMVQAILDEILWWCKEEPAQPPAVDTDFGAADLVGSIADNVGPNNLTRVLSDLFDSLGDESPSKPDPMGGVLGDCSCEDGTVTRLTKSECESKPGCVWSADDDTDDGNFMDVGDELSISDDEIRADIARKCSTVKRLLSDLSVILTPAELSSLFNNNASPVVVDTIVDVIRARHPDLVGKIGTSEQVILFFNKLEKIANVGSIFSQINVISRGLGCTFESRCIRDELRRDNYDGDVPDQDRGNIDRILDMLDMGDPSDLGKPPPVFCEDKGSTIDNGLIPKDNSAILFILEKVVNAMYDGVYMAYDSEIVRIADSVSLPAERSKEVVRTVEQGADISFDVFNFYKMQEEKFTIDMPDWWPKKTVINPEFQRLVSQGYIPPNGDYGGKYGPYTTEMNKLFGIAPMPWPPKPLEAVTIPEKYTVLAPDSKSGLEEINRLKVGSSPPPNGTMYYTLTQPSTQIGFRPTTFVVKFSLNASKEEGEYRNTFTLQIGDIPVDPSTIPLGNMPSGQVIPGISYGPMESAVYRSRMSGITSLDASSERVIEVLQQRLGNSFAPKGAIPQTDIMFNFVDAVGLNGGQNPSLTPQIKDFVYNKMYSDLIMQLSTGIGTEALNSPLFVKTKEDNTSMMKLIDWAPVTPEEQRNCGFDPHILALDTVKRRTKEAYQQYITCSPLTDEISPDGTGRDNLSALEAAGMTGCVMTTLRAYALEQLLRSMYPVSVFAGEEFITKLMVEYIIDETLNGIKRTGASYYDAFLEQVEVVFALRMKEACPFGSVPQILLESGELGINWMYAGAAIKEFNGEFTGEETDTTNQSIEDVTTSAEDCDGPATVDVSIAESSRSSKEQMVRSRLRFLAEEQLYSLIPKLQDLICINGTRSFDDNFLNRRLPLLDVQRDKGEMRLAKMHETLRNIEEEELEKQYKNYLKKFSEWEEGRLMELLGGGFDTILDLADTVGTSIACLVGSFGPDSPTYAATLVEDEEPDTDEPGWIATATSLLGDIGDSVTNLATGETFNRMGTCVDEAVGGTPETAGLVGTIKNMMTVLSDSPPSLESIATGVAVGATDDFGNLKKFARGEGGQTEGKFPLTEENGALILEKYIKVRKKGYTESLETPTDTSAAAGGDAAPDDSGAPSTNEPLDSAENIPHQPSADLEGSSATIATDSKPLVRFGGSTSSGLSISQVLCPREVVDTSTRTSGIFQNAGNRDPIVGSQTMTSLVPKINPDFENIYNISEWEEEMASEVGNRTFGEVYESWSFGVRLVYVAPTNSFEEVGPSSPIGSATPSLKIPTAPNADPHPVDFLFDQRVMDASRSYRQFERSEMETKVQAGNYEFAGAQANQDERHGDKIYTEAEYQARNAALNTIKAWSGNPEDGTYHQFSADESMGNLTEGLGTGDVQAILFPERDTLLGTQALNNQIDQKEVFEKVTMERALTLFPVSEIEIPINIDSNTPLGQAFGAMGVGHNRPNSNLNDLWANSFMPHLMQHMKNSPGYKLFFKYCTPSHTMLSFASIYANLLNEMSETFFDGTKGQLKMLFEILSNGGDYAYENEDLKKKGGNRETFAYAQGNMGTDGASRQPALFDLAIQTPKLIFKGLAEFMDPVIAPAAMIVKAGKAGLFLPKFIKKVDNEGNETQENYLLEITLGPYDLPPPMGKLHVPLPDWLPYRPDNYEDSYTGLSPIESENITFELPQFDLKDMITGQSLSPFMRQKVFGLKNGNAQDKKLFYEYGKAVATFDIVTVIAILVKIYTKAMGDDKCADVMIKKDGLPLVPVPTLIYPGDKLDLPLTPIALATLPIDIVPPPVGIGPPHTPLGYIYHAITAAESLGFLDSDSKARMREKAGFAPKKKPNKNDPKRLCIDMDLIRLEDEKNRG